MKFYTVLFSMLTALCLSAADAVTSATPKNAEPKQPAATPATDAVTSATPKPDKTDQTSVKNGKPVKKEAAAVKKAKPIQKKKAAVKKSVPAQKNKAAIKRDKNNQKAAAPARVNISAFAADAKDLTAAFEKAIRTRTREIVFDKVGSYTLQPVKIPAKMQIIFKEGVKIQGIAPQKANSALPGLFNINNVSKFVIQGIGDNTITAPKGMPVFHLRNSSNVELRNFTIENSSNGLRMNNCYNVRMYNMVFDTIAKNAVEINGGNWNSIYDSQFRNLTGSGTLIVAAQDGKLPNLTIDNCEFFNSTSGIALRRPAQIAAQKPKATDQKVRPARFDIRSCRFFNNSGIDMELCGDLTCGNIRIENNLFSNKVNTALKLVNFSTAPDAVTLQVNNCSFNPGDTNLKPPIVCHSSSELPVGNVKFSNTAVASPVHKEAICFDLKKKSGKLEGILPVIAADGSRLNAILTVEEK